MFNKLQKSSEGQLLVIHLIIIIRIVIIIITVILSSYHATTLRFVWNFFRLENEHLNNCGQFRVVRDISIAPVDMKVMIICLIITIKIQTDS